MFESDKAIPKQIHWCWFGDSAPTRKIKDTVQQWSILMPDYKIIYWNESTFDIDQCNFCKQAYEAKKWAFVSDYARFKIIYEYGGVYMDTGSALLKPIDSLIENGAFTARERVTRLANPGLVLAAEAKNPLIGATVSAYERIEFKDEVEFLYAHTVNEMFCRILQRYGYTSDKDVLWEKNNFTVYPSEYFDPKLTFGGYKITNNTYSTHEGSASWPPEHERFRIGYINKWAPLIGDFLARKIARVLSIVLFIGKKK